MRPDELTVVSALKLSDQDSCAQDKRIAMFNAHHRSLVKSNRETGVQFLHVITPKVREKLFGKVDLHTTTTDPETGAVFFTCTSLMDKIPWNESKFKNKGLASVDTKYVAFTNADTIVLPETIERTIELIPDHEDVIIQGLRWEVPRQVSRWIMESQSEMTGQFWKVVKNLSIPHAFPKNATGEWQVTSVEVAREIGGFDERMTGANSYGGMDTDFHERCRAYLLGTSRGKEITSRAIPILHLHHYAERPYSPNNIIRQRNLWRYIESGNVEDLDWRTAA